MTRPAAGPDASWPSGAAPAVQDRARAVPEYARWVDRGELITTDGTMIDYSRIEADIRAESGRL